MPYRRHSVRRLNPFRGISRVVEGADSRAISTDGINWELQMIGERPAGWGSLNAGRTEARYYRYGVWSAEEGLARYPGQLVQTVSEHSRGDGAVGRLIEALAEAPVETTMGAAMEGGSVENSDSCECWLLDTESLRPMALLAAVATAADIPKHVGSRWRAAPGDANSLAGFGRERAAALERLAARRAGPLAWFERAADGSGKKVGAGATAILPQDAFPELLLSEAWPTADRELASVYFDWLAPRLLMLPLAPTTRARLESAASAQPVEVAHFFHLFPAVIDSVLMNSLRVQARLKHSLT